MKMIQLSDHGSSVSSSVIGVEILIDTETGVNYLNFEGLSPRYKSDGSLYITPPEEVAKLLNNCQNTKNNHSQYIKYI